MFSRHLWTKILDVSYDKSKMSREEKDNLNKSLTLCKQATSLGRDGKFTEASKAAEDAARAKPDLVIPHLLLGAIYAESGKLKEAVLQLNESIKLSPEAPESYYFLGFCYYRNKQYKDAIRNFKEALKKNPAIPEAWYYMANSYSKTGGSSVTIIESLKQAINYDPNLVEAHHYLGRMFVFIKDNKSAEQQYNILRKLDRKKAEELLLEINEAK
jgi:tetratricopeptide (TPR) repeat protein